MKLFSPSPIVFLILSLLMPSIHADAQVNKYSDTLLAPTPPMGWNSWNCFKEDITEAKICSVAVAMVESGMKDAGYEYVILDDGWMTDYRDADGHIIVNCEKFPHGIKYVADFVHSLGLKFGLYSSPARHTCLGRMGSLGYEEIDANDYASWGVDFLKYDQCSFKGEVKDSLIPSEKKCKVAFEKMKRALEATGRSIVFSTNDHCVWGNKNNDLPWIKGIAQMHRTSGDIVDNWDRMLYCLESTVDLWKYAGNGYWNYPDMMEVGNYVVEKYWPDSLATNKMSLREYQTHFSMWCMVASPLIAGNDLRNMKSEIIKILTNKELIAIDQDPLGKQGRRIKVTDSLQLWTKELSGNRLAVAILNIGESPSSMKFTWREIGVSGKMRVRDLWKHKNMGLYRHAFKAKNIKGHEARILLISSIK